MPTALERSGDFSQSLDASGRPLAILDPATGRPFAGSTIPASRLSPQAASLLGYYPLPNLDAAGRFNYQAPVLETRRQDAAQVRGVWDRGRGGYDGDLVRQVWTPQEPRSRAG